MPTMQDEVSVAANAVSTNQLAGLLYEFLDAPAAVVLSCTSSATGIRCTFLAGGVALVNDARISLQNRPPIIPDDVLTEEGIPGGRLIVTFRNVTAGALTVFWRVDVSFQ